MPDPFVDGLAALRMRRSAKWQAYPPDVLPMFVAEMDCELAPEIRAALYDAVARSDTGYAYPLPVLGEALASFALDTWGWTIDPAFVASAPDVGVAMVELLRVLTPSGGSIVISPPVYPPFPQWIAETGRRLVDVPLRTTADGYRLDLDGLEAAFAQGPAAYLLCNPHNPVGRVHSPEELTALVALAHRYNVRVISDEIHAALTLPPAQFTPLLTIDGAADIAVAVESGSKAWNLAGLKCAAMVSASPAMRTLVEQIPPDARWRTGHFGVLATVAALTSARAWRLDLLAALDVRRTLLAELLAARLPLIDYRPPDASFLAWLDCRAYGPDSAAVLLERGRLALEDGANFGAPGAGFVRLNFATHIDILRDAVDRMAAVLG